MCRQILRAAVLVASVAAATPAPGQTPAPFPRPGSSDRTAPQPPPARPATPPPTTVPEQVAAAPTEQMLGVPVHPGAEFLTSYDAGRGQRYYLFGTNTAFAEVVSYYRTALKQRGELVYEEPPVHEFDVGRFREETMAFPPGVTVKDYTWGGSQGYLNPKRGAAPARFRTIIQIVPVVER
jgi:hypothetical protein